MRVSGRFQKSRSFLLIPNLCLRIDSWKHTPNYIYPTHFYTTDGYPHLYSTSSGTTQKRYPFQAKGPTMEKARQCNLDGGSKYPTWFHPSKPINHNINSKFLQPSQK